ncbi:MAG: metal ABC transporter permease [Saprospiraceae bacterium]|nr:metal ABC transporter permease [Saprospiraceae bacterium]
MIEILTEEWAIRALLASSMVGIMCGILGCFIVLRNMALIGDALAHAILPGIVIAFVIVGYSTLAFFLGSVFAGIFSAVVITWIQQKIKTKNDAAIGIVFTFMFSLGIIGISWISRKQGVHLDLKDFLFGNVLGVSDQDLLLTFCVLIVVVFTVITFYRYLFVSTFQPIIAQTMGISVEMIHYLLMLLLSFAVVASLQTVGVILVVAMLITPASTALLLSNKLVHVIIIAACIGFITSVTGLLLAIVGETTPGPAMVLVATFFYLLAVLFAPEKGYLAKYKASRSLRTRIELEDSIKHIFKLYEKNDLSFETLKQVTSHNRSTLKQNLVILKEKGLLFFNNDDDITLTETGKEKAKHLIRAHRLWETYLVNEVGLTEEQIHDEAEQYEHLLTEEILDDLDAKLDFPIFDPHGSLIPKKKR